jgi:betaine reductase
VAERYRPEDMVVLLGTPNAESTRLYALTVTEGDPSWAGALAGVGLGLPVYHVTEEPVKRQVAPEAYEEHVALMEVVLEVEAIARAAQDVRSSAGQPAS